MRRRKKSEHRNFISNVHLSFRGPVIPERAFAQSASSDGLASAASLQAGACALSAREESTLEPPSQ